MVPFFIFSLNISAQENTVSPYSRLGLGDLYSGNYTRALGLGGAVLGVKDALNINPANPASYNSLELTTFEIGFETSIIEQIQESPAINTQNSTSGLRYFAVGVPFKEWWGVGVGIQPYSAKGYNISKIAAVDENTSVEQSFIGNGGLNQIFLGNSFKVAEGLSIGFNANYIFGKIEETKFIDWGTTFFDTETDLVVNIQGFQFDFGAQYSYQLNNGKELGLGITFSNSSKLDATINNYTFTSINNRGIDSLSSSGEVTSSVNLPAEFGIGVSYGKKIELEPNYAWLLSADFEYVNSSSYVNYDATTPLSNSYRVEGGAYITPKYAFKALERSNGYFGKVEYRLGAFYSKTPLTVEGTDINDYGITFGLGLPVRARNLAPGERKINTINTGVILGRRGTLANGLIQENYLNIYIGITLNDKWFIKYKYR